MRMTVVMLVVVMLLVVYVMAFDKDSNESFCNLSTKTLQSLESKKFSQFGEDGVLETIFHCIKPMENYFVELGIKNNGACNTRNLKDNHGWSGIQLYRETITPDTIVEMLKKNKVPREFDLLSISINTTAFWVAREILESFRPRVMMIEFNSNFDLNEHFTLPRDSTLKSTSDIIYGASLAALHGELECFGYNLLYTTTENINAFWIRGDIFPQVNPFSDIWRTVPDHNGKAVDRTKYVDPRTMTKVIPVVFPWEKKSTFPRHSPWNCRWVDFKVDGKKAEMCVHSEADRVSDHIEKHGRWYDCDPLTNLWLENGGKRENVTYLEIGGNIGSCVMHMLLMTDAEDIRVFEPNPRNLFCLTSTLLRLPVEQLKRVTLYPFALGEHALISHIFSAKGNMGNSVIGKVVKDNRKQVMNAPLTIPVVRYDSVIGRELNIALIKMDAQGLECEILRGMGELYVDIIKFEVAQKWLEAQENCDASILFNEFKSRAMSLFDEKGKPVLKPRTDATYDLVARKVNFVLGRV